MCVIVGILIHSSFCVFGFLLPACRTIFSKLAHPT